MLPGIPCLVRSACGLTETMATNTAAVAADPNHNDACLHIPPGQFGGFWKKDRYSDALIRLLIVKAYQQSSNGNRSIVSTGVYKKIPVHKMVLEEGSTYFKGRFTTGEAIAGQVSDDEEAGPATKRARTEKSQEVLELKCDSKKDADANEAVLEFLYNNTLPATPTVSMLCKMIIAADYLGADLCVKACAINITESKLGPSDMLAICGIINKVRSCPSLVTQKLQDALWAGWDASRNVTHTNRMLVKKLEGALFDCLLAKHCDTLGILDNGDLQLSFCKLPLSSIELWGSSDKLQIDSENTVVVLLNKWWKAQPTGLQTEDCKKKLSALVRPASLSIGYLQFGLDKLDWYVAPCPNHAFACSVVKSIGINSLYRGKKPFDIINTAPRQMISPGQQKFQLRFSLEHLKQADSSGNGATSCCEVCRYGHMWSFYIGRCKSENGCVAVKLVITKRAARNLPSGIPAATKITISGEPFQMDWKHLLFEDGHGYAVEETFKATNVVDALKKYLTQDDQLVFNVTISGLQ